MPNAAAIGTLFVRPLRLDLASVSPALIPHGRSGTRKRCRRRQEGSVPGRVPVKDRLEQKGREEKVRVRWQAKEKRRKRGLPSACRKKKKLRRIGERPTIELWRLFPAVCRAFLRRQQNRLRKATGCCCYRRPTERDWSCIAGAVPARPAGQGWPPVLCTIGMSCLPGWRLF